MCSQCFFTFGIALPPVLNVGSDHVKNLCARDVITGKKIMALAVTEPQAGSDVANLTTTAERDGDFFIVNGLKKFISGGSGEHTPSHALTLRCASWSAVCTGALE